MRHAWIGAAIAIVLSLSAGLSLATARRPETPDRWWRDETIQHQLQLTPEQVRRLDTIFGRDILAKNA